MIAILPPEKSKELAREKLTQWKKEKERKAFEVKLKGEAGKTLYESVQQNAAPTARMTPSKDKGMYEKLFNRLQRAAKIGDLNGVRDLFAAGAPLSPAALRSADRNKHYDVVEFLIRSGAEMTPRPNFVLEALFVASKNKRRDLVELLVSKGLDVDTMFAGTPALPLVVKYGAEAAAILIDNGADVNTRVSRDMWDIPTGFWGGGHTVLMVASRYGKMDAVELLIEKGADVNATDNDGKSALDYASKNGHQEIGELLRKHGATG